MLCIWYTGHLLFFYGTVSFDYVLKTRSDGWPSANATLIFTVNFVDQAPVLNASNPGINLTRGIPKFINFTLFDIDEQMSSNYTFKWNSSGKGAVQTYSLCNCTNVAFNPTDPQQVLPQAMGPYVDVQKALATLIITGAVEGDGVFTLTVDDGYLSTFSQIPFHVAPPYWNPPGGLGLLERILIYAGSALGVCLCCCACFIYGAYNTRKQKKKYYEQGYTAEATSMDRL